MGNSCKSKNNIIKTNVRNNNNLNQNNNEVKKEEINTSNELKDEKKTD